MYDNTGFAMEKKPNFFLFFKMEITRLKGKTRHIAWLSSFLFKAPCFYGDEDDLAPDDKYMYYIRGKRNALWLWQHFGRTITLAVFDIPIVSTESQVLYSFIIKVRMDTPIFLFSYLLLIALYTNSTHNLAEKIFCGILFSKFLTRDYFLFFVSSSSIADSGTVLLDTYIKIIVICRDIHRTLRKL